jgi:hypothetical protein
MAQSSVTGMLRIWAIAALVLSVAPCAAQDLSRPPAGNPPVPAQSRGEAPGFFEALGRFFDRSAENFNSGVKDAQSALTGIGSTATDAAKGAATVAKDATDAIVKLPSTRFVSGRERCQTAANGSPDCRAAAELICRSNGYVTGKSLDTQSAQKCPTRVWLSGRLPAEGECPAETFVVRAACQ